MSSRSRARILSLALVGATLATVGCSSVVSREQRAAARQIRKNPSPAMADLNDRNIDLKNRNALTIDENFRMMRDDWREIWLIDRPSRLAPERVPR